MTKSRSGLISGRQMAGDFHCIIKQAANFYGVVIHYAEQDEMPGSLAASCQMAGSCVDMNFRALSGTQMIGITGDIHYGQTYQLTYSLYFLSPNWSRVRTSTS